MSQTHGRAFRVLQGLLYALAVIVLGGTVWTYLYARHRVAAIAHVRGIGGELEFAPDPAWLPRSVTLPEWMKTVERIEPRGGRNCDLACLVALREVQYLGYIAGPVDDVGLRRIGTLRNLKTAFVSNARATHVGTSSLRNCRQLEDLTILFKSISDHTLEPLADVPGWKYIFLNSCHLSDSSLRAIPRIQGLYALDVMDTNLDDAGLALFADLPLECLNLRGTQISDAGLKHLKRMPLRRLRLDCTRITDAGLAELAELPVETLELCDTHVTGRGLLALRGMRTLRVVTIDEQQLTPEEEEAAYAAGIATAVRRPKERIE